MEGGKLHYITGKELAALYRVPYSECLDLSIKAIAKVIDFNRTHNGPPTHLLHLLPSELGIYVRPDKKMNEIIVVKNLSEQVNKNG